MASWDQGGGCACGLNKVCDCNFSDYKNTPINNIKEIIKTPNSLVNTPDQMGQVLHKNNISESSNIKYKYKEDQIIADFKAIIDKTYSEHYKTTDDNIECFDAWIALDDATPTFRNTALKYLWRYGKKNGNNKDDLMKALHYTLMCLYNDHYKK